MRSLLWLLLAALVCAPNAVAAPRADLVFVNANVYTGDAKRPKAEAIAVKGGRIAFVGSTDEAKRFAGSSAKVVDLAGATVVPGFADSHCHLAESASAR